jgi:dihydropteroate synthase
VTPEALVRRAAARAGAALMGVLNVTPDSFHDGGRYLSVEAAQRRVDAMVADGATLLDLGAESSRPGATPVSESEQKRRLEAPLGHALTHAARGTLAVSIDTTHPEVARWALAAGATVLNDVSCLADPRLAEAAAAHGASLVLMHTRGALGAMAGFSRYDEAAYGDVVGEVLAEWRAARGRAVAAGVPASRVWLDPGIGFAKSARQSYALLGRLRELAEAEPDAVLLFAGSRKSFIAAAPADLGGAEDPARCPPEQRLPGTLAAHLLAVEAGATVLRVHDVAEHAQALAVRAAARRAAAR